MLLYSLFVTVYCDLTLVVSYLAHLHRWSEPLWPGQRLSSSASPSPLQTCWLPHQTKRSALKPKERVIMGNLRALIVYRCGGSISSFLVVDLYWHLLRFDSSSLSKGHITTTQGGGRFFCNPVTSGYCTKRSLSTLVRMLM